MNKTIRLVYPQWQGGIIDKWIPDLNYKESSRGYYLGAKLLNFLSPKNESQQVMEVPVSLDINNRVVKNGIIDYDFILEQTNNALNILEDINPDKIIVFGGECSVSVVPFTYLNKKYNDNILLIWLDAHPDITLPNEAYAGYHAMALAHCMGYGDKKIISNIPSKIDSSKVLLIGIRDWERDEIKLRQKEYKIKHLTPLDVNKDSSKIIDWIKNSNANKVFIHFDLDVLDPSEIVAGVGICPNGIKINEAIRIINDIAKEKEIVGLTIAEHMPKIEIMMQNILNNLPLINE